MRITERKLRRIIRGVIRESEDYRLSSDFSMQVERMVDEFKDDFVDYHRQMGIFNEGDLDDYIVEDFLRAYLKETLHLYGERAVRSRMTGNFSSVTPAFKKYLSTRR